MKFLVLALLGLAACQPVTDGASGLHITVMNGGTVTVTQHVNGATTSTPTTSPTLMIPVSALPK